MALPIKPESRLNFLDRHFTVAELAKIWHMAPASVRALFENEPDVIRFGEQRLRKGKKRAYVSMRIPESVAARVYQRKTGRVA